MTVCNMRKAFKKLENSDEYQQGIHNPGNTRLSQLQVNSKLALNSGGILACILPLWITGVGLWKLNSSITWHFSGVATNHNPEEIWANTGVIPERMPSETGSGLGFMWSKSPSLSPCLRPWEKRRTAIRSPKEAISIVLTPCSPGGTRAAN